MRLVIENGDFSAVSIGGASGVVINYGITEQANSLGPTSDGNPFYNTQVSVGSTVDVNSPSIGAKTFDIYSCYIHIMAGDSIFVKVYGGNAARAWAFTDSSFKMLAKSTAEADCTEGVTLTAEQSGYLFVANVNKTFSNTNVVIRRTIG